MTAYRTDGPFQLPGVSREIIADGAVTTFDSWDSFVAHCDAVDTRKGTAQQPAAERPDPDFHGTDTYADALTLARDGWQEKRGDVEALRDAVRTDLETSHGDLFDSWSLRPSTVHGVAGAFVDMGAFLSGDPECMVDFAEVEEPRSGRLVRILVDAIYSGSTDTDLVVRRGAVVVALVELLEQIGFGTEVWLEANNTGGGRGQRITHLIRAKSGESPLDVDALMFAVAHPSTLRRLLFRSWEGETAEIRRAFRFHAGQGYGHCGPAVSADRLGAHVTLTAASAHKPETANPAAWIAEIIGGLFSDGAE